MEAARGRRKHGALALRLRETCPLRRLRRNRCYDIQNTSAAVNGDHWHPNLSVVHVDGDAAEGSREPPARAAAHPAARVHLQDHYAMDTGNINSQCPRDLPPTCSPVLPEPLPSNLQSSPTHRVRSVLHRGTSMELDSDVDPETGEKAQG